MAPLALTLALVVLAHASPALALSPTPTPGPSSSPSPAPSLSVTAPRASSTASAAAPLRATASPTPHDAPEASDAAAEPEPQPQPEQVYVVPTAALPNRPRAFRTPAREAPPVFVAPQAAPPPVDDAVPDAVGDAPAHMPAARAGSATVVFRTVARTAIEGFDLLVTYPLALGDFAGSGDQVQCTGIAGAILAANDHDDGTLRLLVASGQTLPSPLAITCRFTLASGAALDARAFGVDVREVAAGGRVADRGLLTVAVDVR